MFNWLSGRQKSALPEPTALQQQRSKQIEQLKVFNQNVSEIQRDVEYRVNTLVTGTTFSIYLTLPPQFPQDKPIVRVSPAANHPWINNQNIVTGCPGLNNFVVHSDLGKIIRELIEEFQRNPPALSQSYGVTQYPTHSMPQPAPMHTGYNSMNVTSRMPGYMSQVAPPTLPPSSTVAGTVPHVPPSYMAAPHTAPNTINSIPTAVSFGGSNVPLSFPQLKDLSNEELNELQSDDKKLEEFIDKLGILQGMSCEKQRLIDENEQFAMDNISHKPVLEDRKKILLEKYDQLNELRSKFDELSQRQDELRQVYDPQLVRNNLQVAAMQAEEEAETIAEQFIDGNIPIDEFTKKYMNVRSLSYLRKAKEEKFTTALVQNKLY